MINVWDTVSAHIHIPRMFLSVDYLYKKWIGQVTSPSLSDFHTILRKIRRGVPGLATGSPCGVWNHGWTTCLLCDGPLLGLGFWLSVGTKVWYGGEECFSWFLAFILVLYITQILPIIFPLKLIYSQIAYLYSVLYSDIFHRYSLFSV